ncbi:MAG: hypothetical protein AAF138_04060 [Planctomycetota bacterium]
MTGKRLTTRQLASRGSSGPPAPQDPACVEPAPAPLTFFLSHQERAMVLRRLRGMGGSRAAALLKLVGSGQAQETK